MVVVMPCFAEGPASAAPDACAVAKDADACVEVAHGVKLLLAGAVGLDVGVPWESEAEVGAAEPDFDAELLGLGW